MQISNNINPRMWPGKPVPPFVLTRSVFMYVCIYLSLRSHCTSYRFLCLHFLCFTFFLSVLIYVQLLLRFKLNIYVCDWLRSSTMCYSVVARFESSTVGTQCDGWECLWRGHWYRRTITLKLIWTSWRNNLALIKFLTSSIHINSLNIRSKVHHVKHGNHINGN